MNRKTDRIIKEHQERLRQAQKSFTSRLRGTSEKQGFFVGNNAINKKQINLDSEEFNKHWHILGATGKGKSKYLEHLIRTLIENHQGLCLIDPHGDLYQEVLNYAVYKRLDDKLILLDPNRDDVLFGINYLERGEHIVKDIANHVGMVMRAIAKVFGGENQDTLPRLQRWERNTIHALMETKLTLVEILDFLSLNDPDFRVRVIEDLNDRYIQKEWLSFEALGKREKETLLESVLNRAVKFVGSERIRRIVGQGCSTVNFRQAMDEGKIVLVNLSPLHISREAQKMLGVIIVDLIIEAAFSRTNLPENKRKPFYFIVDEFGEFVCDDFASALVQLRKYKVFLMLSNQLMDQLKQENDLVYGSVMSCCENKVVFGISREDAEIMAKELFTGMIRGDQIKDIIEQTKFWPHETSRTLSGKSSSTSASSGKFSGETKGEILSVGHGEVFGPEGPEFFADALAQSFSSSEVKSLGASTGTSEFSSSSEGNFESNTPWYEYEPFKEISSKAFFSPAEILEKFISWIKNQGPRHAQLKIGTRRPIPIITPQIEGIKVRAIDVERLEKKVNLLYSKPIQEIDEEIQERRRFLVGGRDEGVKSIEPEDFRE